MAGDWIKVENVTPDKPEVYRMATILGVSPEDVMGRLVRVWVWADQQSLDGNAVGVTEVTLDAVSRRNGFGAAMREVGWLGVDGATLSFPNFGRHNGETAKKRALTNKRVKRYRNADGVSDALPEKRREEIKEKEEAAPDGARLWRDAVKLLVSKGDTEQDARRFIGRLLKEWDEEDVAEALLAAESAKGDPKAYARSVLKSRAKKVAMPPEHRDVLSGLRAKYGDDVRLSDSGTWFYSARHQRQWNLDGTVRPAL